MYEANDFIRAYIHQHITTQWQVYFDCVQDIINAANLITTAFQNGNKLFICGNGGSAADAQHLAGELVPMGLPAIALTTDTSAITAIGNDISFQEIFGKQVQAIGKEGDVLIAISTSGKSINVRYAAYIARKMGIKVVALTGKKAWAVNKDVSIQVPSANTQHIQEAHTMICHLIWLLVKEALI